MITFSFPKKLCAASVRSRFVPVLLSLVLLTGVLTAGVTISAPAVNAATIPGYVDELVTNDVNFPVALEFATDGRMFIAERGGSIKVFQPGSPPTTFGSVATNSEYEQGLLGLALDPNFTTNGYMYVAYTAPDGNTNQVARLTASTANPNVMEPGSEKLLLTGIPSPTGIHQMGEMHAIGDKLYIAAGDGAIDAVTSGQLDVLSGKILRINTDGTIPADNPFVGRAGARGEIWAYGVRNPFTSSVQPGTGRFFFNDVGGDNWEEINELQKGGNYGWTECEGRCNPARPGLIDPVFQYNHNEGYGPVVGRSTTGAAWYAGSAYPADFVGDYFFADYVSGWIKKLDPASGVVTDFANGLQGIVHLQVGPDGLLYYVKINLNDYSSSIHKIVPGVAPPTSPNTVKIFAAGTPALGVYPTAELLIDDVVVATYTNVRGNPAAREFVTYTYEHTGVVTPERVKVRFTNNADDGAASPIEDRNLTVDKISIGGTDYETEAPSVLSTGTWTPDVGCAPGNKRLEVLSCGGYFQYGTATGPVVTIDTPATGLIYRAGDTVAFSGSANDAEDGVVPASNYIWIINFHHGEHNHPVQSYQGIKSGQFKIPTSGETGDNVYFRINLIVSDSSGAETTVSRDVLPHTAAVTLNTDPAGLSVRLDGAPFVAPKSFNGVTGLERVISVDATQALNGTTYEFVGWSDGGAASHSIKTPEAATTFTAVFRDASAPVTTTTTARPVTTTTTAPPVTTTTTVPPVTPSATPAGLTGYRVVDANGLVKGFGQQSETYGDGPRGDVVALTNTADDRGYWQVTSAGNVFAAGNARFHGDLGGVRLNAPIVAMTALPDGSGYWLLGRDGGVFSFGAANFYGSTGSLKLNAPVVGITATTSGQGYWFVASDGGIFAYGDARFQGSMGGTPLNKPVVGMAASPNGAGYWLVASDGGVFSFDVPFYGSTGDIKLNAPIIGMTASQAGTGYQFVAVDGGIFNYNVPFYGSLAAAGTPNPVRSITS